VSDAGPVARRLDTIAIDGPAGAGKSTVGAALARRLGYSFFDTGILYRAVTLAAWRLSLPMTDEAALAALAAVLNLTFAEPTIVDGRQMTVLLDGEDVTWALRQPAVNDRVSTVSAHAAVRQALLARQREIGQQGGIVMVGRDIGTTVLPDADIKVYLNASAQERAERRVRERRERGETTDLESELAGVLRRDEIDSQRAASPLRIPGDAVIIESDGLSADEVVERLLHLCGGVHVG
jgi:cytidylate kinase